MMWLVWRQHRKQMLFALIGFAALAAVLIPTGRQTRRAAAAVTRCFDGLGRADFAPAQSVDACMAVQDKFTSVYDSWAYPAVLLVFLPMLVGLFWGAPVVAREVEQGTHRLVWTQGITRRRWALTKFGLIGAAVIVFATAYALLISWWMDPLNETVEVRFDYLFFDLQGAVPVGYTLFAVALGIVAGTVTRKVLPAMAATFVGFLAARIAVIWLIRPNIQEPVTHTVPVATDAPVLLNPAVGNWQLASGLYNADGTMRASDSIAFCTGKEGMPCPDSGAYNRWVYQPGDRFWLFQWVEVGLFVALSAALLYVALWQVRRRIA